MSFDTFGWAKAALIGVKAIVDLDSIPELSLGSDEARHSASTEDRLVLPKAKSSSPKIWIKTLEWTQLRRIKFMAKSNTQIRLHIFQNQKLII